MPALSSVALASPALAQDLFAAPTSLLNQARTWLLSAPGATLGGLLLAAFALAAATPRIPVGFGAFIVVVLVLCVVYGSFGMVEAIQGLVG